MVQDLVVDKNYGRIENSNDVWFYLRPTLYNSKGGMVRQFRFRQFTRVDRPGKLMSFTTIPLTDHPRSL